MTVKVVENDTGKTVTGKFAVVEKDLVALWSGCMSDKKGGLRGCGRKQVFPAERVSLSADDPAREIK